MKIAICFSGAIRSFDTCIYSTMRNLINELNKDGREVDIFMHLWNYKEEDNEMENKFKWRKNKTEIERIIKILNPKDYVIEKFDKEQENKIIELSKIDIKKLDDENKINYGINCCSMYYKIYKSFELAENYSKKNNKEYELYIRARLDFIWEKKIKIEEIEEDKLYLIKDRYATCSKLITNDKFFGGSYEIMKKMCNIFNKIKEYEEEGIMIEGQTINEYHIKKEELKVEWIGDKNTYYKCMGRHDIKFRKTKYNIILEENRDRNEYKKLINEIIIFR